MKVILEPRAGDKLSDQIDLANEILTKGYVDEVQLQMHDGLKFMRSPMDEEQIRKFIYKGYNVDSQMFRAEDLDFVPFVTRIGVGFGDKMIFTTSDFNDQNDMLPMFERDSLEEIIENIDVFDEVVKNRFYVWCTANIIDFEQDYLSKT